MENQNYQQRRLFSPTKGGNRTYFFLDFTAILQKKNPQLSFSLEGFLLSYLRKPAMPPSPGGSPGTPGTPKSLLLQVPPPQNPPLLYKLTSHFAYLFVRVALGLF